MEIVLRELKKASKKVYESNKKSAIPAKKNALVVSHELKRGGAPLVLLEMIDLLLEDYNVTLISIEDGELRDSFLECGIDVLVGNILSYAKCPKGVWHSFDLVFLNTILTHSFLACFQNTNVPVLWWLHEPELLFQATYGRCIPFGVLSDNIRVLPVTRETQQCIRKYYGIQTDILHMGLADRFSGEFPREDGKVRFFQPAKFQQVKGQDIMAQAIIALPAEYMSKTEFYFAGCEDDKNPEYYQLIEKLSVALPNVFMLGERSREEIYDYYQQVDCIVAPSRADATPTTIVEGMMFHKITLCSNATGISKYLEDGISGYIVEAENVSQLRDKIMYIVDHKEEWDKVKDAGRSIYLQQFEKNQVKEQLSGIIMKMDAGKERGR